VTMTSHARTSKDALLPYLSGNALQLQWIGNYSQKRPQ